MNAKLFTRNVWAIALLALSWFCTSCETTYTHLSHYVARYNLDLSALTIQPENQFLYIRDTGVEGIWADTNNDEERKQFLKLSEKNGDIGYNREIEFNSQESLWHDKHQYLAEQIVAVDIKASNDWNGKMESGASLNHLFYIYSLSPDKYLQNKFKLDFEKENTFSTKIPEIAALNKQRIVEYKHTALPFGGLVSEVNLRNYRLIGCNERTYFALFPINTPPSGAGLRVTLTFESGAQHVMEYTYP